MKYTKLENGIIERENEDGSLTFIPMDEANSDYQNYLASLDADSEGTR